MRLLNALVLMTSLTSPAAFAQSSGLAQKAATQNAVRHTPGSGFLFQGQFAADTDEREFFVTLQQAGALVARTLSYAGGSLISGAIPRGGFDPTLTLFDSTGRLVAANEDGGCGPRAADAVTGQCWDSYLSLLLPAGTYRLVLTQSTNGANGPTLSDSFKSFCSQANQTAGNCTQNFTPNPQPGVLPDGFWDETRDRRTASYAVQVLGAPGAITAVEPSINSSAALPGGVV